MGKIISEDTTNDYITLSRIVLIAADEILPSLDFSPIRRDGHEASDCSIPESRRLISTFVAV